MGLEGLALEVALLPQRLDHIRRNGTQRNDLIPPPHTHPLPPPSQLNPIRRGGQFGPLLAARMNKYYPPNPETMP